MKRFLKKILLFVSPVVAVVGIYIILDPFMVVHHHSPFFERECYVGINPNVGYVSTMTYIENLPEQDYDSFIFGNSRSVHFLIDDWQQHIDPAARCFHFNADGESLYGMLKKIELIDSLGGKLSNALLIVDNTLLGKAKNNEGHLFAIPPALEGGRGKTRFQWQYIKAFLTPRFTVAYADYAITGKIKDYMRAGFFVSDEYITYDYRRNELKETGFEREIAAGTFYTPTRKAYFTDFPGTVAKPSIGAQQAQMLTEIATLLHEHHTNYKVIVCPIFNKIKLNPADLAFLQATFGIDAVYDFSGVNSYTADYRGYYDAYHPRPTITRQIINQVYAD